jgi:hypothetical protein
VGGVIFERKILAFWMFGRFYFKKTDKGPDSVSGGEKDLVLKTEIQYAKRKSMEALFLHCSGSSNLDIPVNLP